MAKERTNPFYIALLIAGTAFAVTACAYAMMIVVKQRDRGAGPSHPLVELMQDKGLIILLVELGLLTVFTFAAIGTDDWWQGGSGGKEPVQEKEPPEDPTKIEKS